MDQIYPNKSMDVNTPWGDLNIVDNQQKDKDNILRPNVQFKLGNLAWSANTNDTNQKTSCYQGDWSSVIPSCGGYDPNAQMAVSKVNEDVDIY